MSTSYRTALARGTSATLALLGVYFLAVSWVSGWGFARDQFNEFWYYVIALALGFGVQIGLYAYLKQLVRHTGAPGMVVAATGMTSTAAMISCCAHYLVNIIPLLGVTGIAALVGEYQVRFFWLGLAANLAGIAFIVRRITQVKRS